MNPCPKPEPRPKKARPACKCGKPCAWYGPVGGYSVACIDCNRKNATRQRAARKTWMRKKAPRRIARETPAEKYYKAWIHTQPCVCGCNLPVQQSHLRDHTGMALKESNFISIAMCIYDHGEWGTNSGRFSEFSQLERFAWFANQVAKAH